MIEQLDYYKVVENLGLCPELGQNQNYYRKNRPIYARLLDADIAVDILSV